ncbi:hypothetical protein ACHAWC_001944 [Mediolabrus comicus]
MSRSSSNESLAILEHFATLCNRSSARRFESVSRVASSFKLRCSLTLFLQLQLRIWNDYEFIF